MDPIERLAEQRIQEAISEGLFDDLPGAGKPLPQEDLALVPEDLRAGYRLLKNGGFLPPELEGVKDLRAARAICERLEDADGRERERKRIGLLEARLLERRGCGLSSRVLLEYADRLSEAWD